MENRIVVTAPNGDVAFFDNYIKAGEDLVAVETGKGNVPQEMLDRFWKMLHGTDTQSKIGMKRMTIFMYLLCGYKVGLRP